MDILHGHQLDRMENKLNDLLTLGIQLMSSISDFAAAQAAINAAIDASIASLQSGVPALEALIAQLQSNPAAITPADQALLDALSAHQASVASSLAALASLANPPAPAPVPVPVPPAA